MQSYFVKRIEKFLNSKGRQLIGWDEILQGGLAPNAIVMDWIGGGVAAANTGHDVVMTPTSHCYFDYGQGHGGEPRNIGGYIPLIRVYSFEPVPPQIAGDKAHHVLGPAATCGASTSPTMPRCNIWPTRGPAPWPKITWTDLKQKKWEDFVQRLDTHLLRLQAQKVRFSPAADRRRGLRREEVVSGAYSMQKIIIAIACMNLTATAAMPQDGWQQLTAIGDRARAGHSPAPGRMTSTPMCPKSRRNRRPCVLMSMNRAW